MKKTLITGAAGFIGSHVARYFCRQAEYPVCYVKKTTNTQYLKSLPVEIFYGDILDTKQLYKAMQDIDTVIHIAAMAKDWGDYNTFYNINVEGTLNVLKAGHQAKVRQFIITGSISSYGEENNQTVKDETSPYNSHYNYLLDRWFPCKMNYYRDTKAIATQKAIEYAEAHLLNMAILEPTWVYGEREINSLFFNYMKTVKSGIPFFPGSKLNKLNVIYTKDLARAYWVVYKKRPKGINRFIIGNKTSVNMDECLSLFCREAGISKPILIPLLIVYPIALIMEAAYNIWKSEKPPALTRGRINMLYDNIEYSTAKAAKQLSFTNQYTLNEGISRTVRWYKMQHLI